MSVEKKQKYEKRNYFRVDDVIPVVANPVGPMNEKERETIKTAAGSKVFPLFDTNGSSEVYETDMVPESQENKRLYEMMKEIKTKLDFLINHFMLEKEGLLSTEKKPVNISASGIRFTVAYPVKEGDIIEIKLLLPTYPPVAVFAYGEVKRVKALDDQTYEVALEYLNMGESVRNEIIQYTLNHQRETINRMKEYNRNE
jgi:hypothetical protein